MIILIKNKQKYLVNIYYKNGQNNKGSWRLDLRGNKNYKKDLKKRF